MWYIMFAMTSSDLLLTMCPFSVRWIKLSAWGVDPIRSRTTTVNRFVLRRAVSDFSGFDHSKSPLVSVPWTRRTILCLDRVKAV